MKYAFITEHSKQFGVRALSHALDVSKSGYYAWAKRKPSKRTKSNVQLLDRIRAIHSQYREAYGALKPWQCLKAQDIACGKHRVARLRTLAGIEAMRKRRFRLTVEHHHTPEAAPDLLNVNFRQPPLIESGSVT